MILQIYFKIQKYLSACWIFLKTQSLDLETGNFFTKCLSRGRSWVREQARSTRVPLCLAHKH